MQRWLMRWWGDRYIIKLIKKGAVVWRERDGETYFNIWEDKLLYAIRYHRILTETIAGVLSWIIGVLLASVLIVLIEM